MIEMIIRGMEKLDSLKIKSLEMNILIAKEIDNDIQYERSCSLEI